MSKVDLGNGFSLDFPAFQKGSFVISREGASSDPIVLPKGLAEIFEKEYKKQKREKERRQFASQYKLFTEIEILFQKEGHVEEYKGAALLLSSMPVENDDYVEVQRFTFYLIDYGLLVEGFGDRVEMPFTDGGSISTQNVIYIDKETPMSLANFKHKYQHTIKFLPKC